MAADCRALPLSRVLVLQRGVDLTEEERVPGRAQVITTAGVVGTHTVAVENGPGIVIGRYGSVGSVHWVDGPYWPHNTTLYVKQTYGNNLKWLYFLLRSFPYAAMQARAAIPGINRNDMASELVPWIPVDRQVRVAEYIESRTAEDAVATDHLARSIALLAEYKASLITAAVTGELDVTTVGSGIPG